MFSPWVGVVLLFVVFGLFVAVIISAMPRGDDYEARRAKTRIEKLNQARKESAETLSSYGWVDKNKGIVHVPIDRAMELTIAELASRKPMPAGPIAAPEPISSPSPAGNSLTTPVPSPAAAPTRSKTP